MIILTITGSMCDICPVSSNTITEVEIVCVTLPDKAAAPFKNINKIKLGPNIKDKKS